MAVPASPFEIYQTYLALKLHFKDEKFDFFKYNKKVRVPESTFNKRKDVYYFQKLARQLDWFEILLSNVLHDPKFFIKNVFSDECQKIYQNWVASNQSLTYNLQNHLSCMDDDFDTNFKINNGQLPKILALYIDEKISLETLIVLLSVTRSFAYINKHLANHILWPQYRLKIIKYRPFIKFDKEKIKKIIVQHFSEKVSA